MARKRGGQPGNTNALKHGFYSPGFKPNESDDLEAANQSGVLDEIRLLRVVIRRVFERANQADNLGLDEWAAALNALGGASTRLAGLLRIQKVLDGESGEDVASALSQALKEVTNGLC